MSKLKVTFTGYLPKGTKVPVGGDVLPPGKYQVRVENAEIIDEPALSESSLAKKEHIERHKELHESLDELLADFITCEGQRGVSRLPSTTTVMELLEWSGRQLINPYDPDA